MGTGPVVLSHIFEGDVLVLYARADECLLEGEGELLCTLGCSFRLCFSKLWRGVGSPSPVTIRCGQPGARLSVVVCGASCRCSSVYWRMGPARAISRLCRLMGE